MKITDVRTVLLTGPLTKDPWVSCLRQLRSAAFIEILTDTELVGIGETYTGYHAPEIVPAMVDFFKPILMGLSETDIDPRELWRRMYHCGNFWARVGAGVNVLAGLEGALWDLRGKLENKPVYELLARALEVSNTGASHCGAGVPPALKTACGAGVPPAVEQPERLHHNLGNPSSPNCTPDRLPCYATGSVSPYPWSQLCRKIDAYRAAGFHAAKVATGWYDAGQRKSFWSGDPQAWADLESQKLETILHHAGEDFSVALDAHMSNDGGVYGETWNVSTASKVLKALERFNLVFFEEPLHYNDLSGYAQLCRETTVPVAGGECLTTVGEFAQYAEAEALDIAQPDASYIGIGPFLQTARLFAAHGRRVATHSWSSGVGTMENIHAAFASPNIAILEMAPLAGPLHTEVYADGYRFENGYILPPQAPGLGVRLTDKLKAKYPFVPGSGEWNVVPGGKGMPR